LGTRGKAHAYICLVSRTPQLGQKRTRCHQHWFQIMRLHESQKVVNRRLSHVMRIMAGTNRARMRGGAPPITTAPQIKNKNTNIKYKRYLAQKTATPSSSLNLPANLFIFLKTENIIYFGKGKRLHNLITSL